MTENVLFGLSQISKSQDKKKWMCFILHVLAKMLEDIKTINTH